MQNVPLILHTGCGLVFAIVALPLMLRRVPMNHAYSYLRKIGPVTSAVQL